MDIKEILQKMQEKLDAAQKAEGAEEKNALMDEFDALKAQKEAAERMDAAEKAMVARAIEQAEAEEPKAEDDAEKQFAAAARARFKGMNENTAASGGYTVPEDISTRVEKLREAKRSLQDLVGVESVKTLSGARTFQKRASQAGFTSVEEGGKLPVKGTPEFSRLTYKVVKYGGIFPVTDELLDDSDAAIVSVLTEWIAGESRVTRNKLILATLDEPYTGDGAKTAKEVSKLDDIKEIVNVELGQAFAPTSVIVTNDSGLNWLDTLKDDNANYLLKVHNNDPLRKQLACGSLVIPVDVVPNADLPNNADGTIPMYIGDLKEGVRLFDRKQLSIKSSDVAAAGTGEGALNAFDEDLTLFRAIERLDCVVRDDQAFVKASVKANAAG